MPRCPVCRNEFEETESSPMPFCCERCRLVDLGRWLDEEYSVAADPEQAIEEEIARGEMGEEEGEP